VLQVVLESKSVEFVGPRFRVDMCIPKGVGALGAPTLKGCKKELRCLKRVFTKTLKRH